MTPLPAENGPTKPPKSEGPWVNAVLTLDIPIDLPVDADPYAKQEAVADLLVRVFEALPSELSDHTVGSAKWEDVTP